MQVGRAIQNTGRAIAKGAHWLGERFTVNPRGTGWRLTRKVLLGAAVFVVLWYGVGMWVVHRIDDDPAFTFSQLDHESGGSRAVGIATALVRREVRVHDWVSNDPWFMPGVLNDNMQHYQQGIMAAVYRFTSEMRDFLGRARGSSGEDADLRDASGRLNYPSDIWYWNPGRNLLPQRNTESVYMEAADALRRYNMRVATGAAVFDRRADNLADALDRISKDLGGSTANLFAMASEHPGWFLFDWRSDDTFYEAKGKAYAYYLILRELKDDFERIIREKELGATYGSVLDSLQAAIAIDPFVIVNGRLGSQFTPNHLAQLGFNLERARVQLRELTAILRA
ncbi:MAG: DUF2333 family protein [Alphaproteobacteria bacterium]|nr:DUF2333 family protein [Alphaproteobacteria bacterium]